MSKQALQNKFRAPFSSSNIISERIPPKQNGSLTENGVNLTKLDPTDDAARLLILDLEKKLDHNRTSKEIDPPLPDHLERFKNDWELFQNRIRLPLVRQLSARTKRRISQLPPATDNVIQKSIEIQKTLENSRASGTIYQRLTRIADTARAKAYRVYADPKLEDIYTNVNKVDHGLLMSPLGISDENIDFSVENSSTSYYDRLFRRKEKEERMRISLLGVENTVGTPHKRTAMRSPSLSQETNAPARTLPRNHASLPPLQFRSELAEYVLQKSAANSIPNRTGGERNNRLLGEETAVGQRPGPLEKNVFPPLSHDPSGGSGLQGAEKGSANAPKEVPGNASVPTSSASSSGNIPENSCADLDLSSAHTATVTLPASSPNNQVDTRTLANNLLRNYVPVLEETFREGTKVRSAYESALVQMSLAEEAQEKSKQKSEAMLDMWKADLLDRSGVNVDAAFNEKRRLGNACEIFFYQFYISRLKAAISKMKWNTVLVNRQRRQAGSALLIRVVRGFLSRKHVRAIRRNIQIMKEAAEKLRQQEEMKRHRAARAILMCWKTVQACRLLRAALLKKQSAIQIQRVVRGRAGRKLAKKRVEYLRMLHKCATVIQCLWRMVHARKQVRARENWGGVELCMTFYLM